MRGSLLGLAALLAALAPSLAAAQSTVTRAIVLTFEGGRRGDTARDAVIGELMSHVELVTEDQAIESAAAMGIDVSTPEGLAEVVRELGVTLVVMGAVRGRGRDLTTELAVVDPDGAELARAEGPGPRSRASLAEIGQLAVSVIDEANAALAARDAPPEPEPEPEPAPVVAPPEEPEAPEEPERTGWRHPLALVVAGLRLRTLAISVDDQATNTRHFFESAMYPEIALAAWFRPLTDDGDELARGLLLGLRGSFSVGTHYLDGAGDERGMTSFRFRADVGYGYTIDDLVEIQGMVGFGIDGLELEMADAFPNVLMSYLRPAAVVRVALYESMFVLEGGAGARIGLDGGGLAGAFGPGLVFGGVDLSIGFTGVVEPGFAWAATFGYQLHALGFEGDGGTIADGDAGRDEALELRILVGWGF